MKMVCGKLIGETRICILHPDHEIPCSANLPTEPIKHKFEDAMLVFQFGIALASYDHRYFIPPGHCTEAVEFHANRLGLILTDDQLDMLKVTVENYFNG